MRCRNCGFENKQGLKMCENCGGKIKRNGFGIFLIVLLVMVLIYFIGINVASYVMYNEPAGFLPNIKKEEPKKETKKSTKKETKKDNNDKKEIKTAVYKANVSEIEVNKKLEFKFDDDFTVSIMATKEYSSIYTLKFFINGKEIPDIEYDSIYVDKEDKTKEGNEIIFTRFGDVLLYERQGRTDIKQLNLYAFYKDGKMKEFKNEEIDTDLDLFPYSYEVKDNKLVIEGRRYYHGPSVIYNNNYYGVCREEQEGIGLAKDLPQDLAIVKNYYFDSSLEKVDTKTTKTLAEYLEENKKYCDNN